VNNNVNRHNCR